VSLSALALPEIIPVPVARIKHTFSMQVQPERAQDAFVTDIAPEIHRSAQISLLRQETGRVTFATLEPSTYGNKRRSFWGPLIDVRFELDTLGTKITIRGHCKRKLREALEQLGTPGHWPETADQPHD
jgi:hypothetical protein